MKIRTFINFIKRIFKKHTNIYIEHIKDKIMSEFYY